MSLILIIGCQNITKPKIDTVDISEITDQSARSGGNIVDDRRHEIISKGILLGLSKQPTIDDNVTRTDDGDGDGYFETLVEGLSQSTTYYLRAYAVNNKGVVGYGKVIEFKTKGKPIIHLSEALNVFPTAAIFRGFLIENGGAEILNKGFVWNVFANPTIDNCAGSVYSRIGTESFIDTIVGLLPLKIYHVRAFAENDYGVNYSGQIQLKTDKLSDIEGNIYQIVKIGDQVWMAENLKTTKFNDGSSVDLIIDASDWITATKPAYSWYDNDSVFNKDLFGALYNYYTVDTSVNGNRNLCPLGWRMPEFVDFENLEKYLSGNGYGFGIEQLAIAKTLASEYGWQAYDEIGTPGFQQNENNSSGFSALPGGRRSFDDGIFSTKSVKGYWWSVTDYLGGVEDRVWLWEIRHESVNIYRYGTFKRGGFSVRCIMDE
jgi:uncharacterized protein (TIGR02145 family)